MGRARPPAFFEGERVSVVYDPADPAFPLDARIASLGELWGASLFGVVFGIGFAGIALTHWFIIVRRKRKMGA